MTFLLSADLPHSIQPRLASLCYGLPNVQWLEEGHFHLNLRFFGKLSPNELDDVRIHLKNLFFHPMSIILETIGHYHQRSDRGVIWAGVKGSLELENLKKEINILLKGLALAAEHSPQFIVPLGYYEKLNPDKLNDYLMDRALFQSPPLDIQSCSLLLTRVTSKRIIFETVEQYFASPPVSGED